VKTASPPREDVEPTGDGDADLEEAHRNQESRKCPVCTPLVYLWDPGDGSPGSKSASKNSKFSHLRNLGIVVKVIILAKPHRITA
jgi:hypothetical protein